MGRITTNKFFVTFIFFISVLRNESAQPPFSCDSSNSVTASFPFCNASLPISERVNDLVSRLTVDEKVLQLVNRAPEISRLSISAYEWWSEALHGVSRQGKGTFFNGTITAATQFPQVILTASAFDENLWYRIARVRTYWPDISRMITQLIIINISQNHLYSIS